MNLGKYIIEPIDIVDGCGEYGNSKNRNAEEVVLISGIKKSVSCKNMKYFWKYTNRIFIEIVLISGIQKTAIASIFGIPLVGTSFTF